MMGAFDPNIHSRGEAIDFIYGSNPLPLPVGWYLVQYIDRCITFKSCWQADLSCVEGGTSPYLGSTSVCFAYIGATVCI